VVLMTDFADFPPHFWIEPGLDRLIVGSARAEAQAAELGLPRERVRRHSGMLLHPRFYAAGGVGARARTRAELSIPESAFVVTVLFGGQGAAEMEPLSRALLDVAPGLHVIALCGHNPALVTRLEALQSASNGRLHARAFTERVADFMAACDVLAAKPGPGVLAEAFQQRVPVIVTCHRGTIPQERYNAEMLREQELGLVVANWQEIPAAVQRLLHDRGQRARFEQRLAALPPNRAVYEALDVLEAEAHQGLAARTMGAASV
jgi:1,2-diacylglycerol 3-beta-galactosyltransferase